MSSSEVLKNKSHAIVALRTLPRFHSYIPSKKLSPKATPQVLSCGASAFIEYCLKSAATEFPLQLLLCAVFFPQLLSIFKGSHQESNLHDGQWPQMQPPRSE
jgi:hypothetical protein